VLENNNKQNGKTEIKHNNYVELAALSHIYHCIDSKRLTIIQSQPGFGKSVLLKNIYKSVGKKRKVWISITEADNNPVYFLEKIVSILQVVAPEVNTNFINQLDIISYSSYEPIIYSLLAACIHADITYIFIDDVDILTSPVSNQIVNAFISGFDNPFHLITTCSYVPNFSHSNLLLNNEVNHISDDDLKFTLIDIQKFFHNNGVSDVDDSLFQELLNVTEGWPLAIKFALFYMKEGGQLNLIVKELNDGHKSISTYFSEKSYDKQSDECKLFMQKVSVVDDFNLSLCYDITQDQNSHLILATLIKNNIFINEQENGYYRFHSLFLNFIKQKAKFSVGDVALLECSERAANWLHNNGYVSHAIELALSVSKFDMASLWMLDNVDVVLKKGRHLQYIHWINKLPSNYLNKYPFLRANYMLALCLTKQFEKTQESVDILLSQSNYFEDEVAQVLKRKILLTQCLTLGLNDNIQGLNLKTNHWLTTWGHKKHFSNSNDYHFELALINLVKGFSCKCISAFDEGKASLIDSLNHFRVAESHFGVGWSIAILSVLYAKQGFHHEALNEASEGLKYLTKNLGEESHLGYMLSTLVAAIYYEYGNIYLAKKHLENGLPYIKEQGSTDILVASFQTQYKIKISEGAIEEGIGLIKDAIKWSENMNLTRLKLTLLDDLITVLVLNNRIKEAKNYLQHHFEDYNIKLSNYDLSDINNRMFSKSIVHLLMATNQYSNAIAILNQLIARTRERKQIRQLSYFLMLIGLTYFKKGNHEIALSHLIESIDISRTRKYISMYHDEGQALYDFLHSSSQMSLTNEQKTFVKLLLNLSPKSLQSKIKLIEPLTDKETEIVQQLQTGLPNKEVSSKMNISEGTLKWHLHNIYMKLNVKNRTQALLAAKENGYI